MLAQRMHAQGSHSASVYLHQCLHETKPPYLGHLCVFNNTAEYSYSPDRSAYTAHFGTGTNEHSAFASAAKQL